MTSAEQDQSPITSTNDRTLRIELLIAQLLRWGVVISFVIVAIGAAGLLGTGQTGIVKSN